MPETPHVLDSAVELKSPYPKAFLRTVIGLVVAFGLPIYSLFRFAMDSGLYSYIILVPPICVYLFRNCANGTRFPNKGNSVPAVMLIGFGGILIGGFWAARFSGVVLSLQDSLSITILSFVVFVAGAAAIFLDRAAFRKAAFPLFFLVFMAPFPVAAEQALEHFLQHGSAPPAYWFIKLAGTPVFKEGMVFQLPGISLQIAPECSGIRSSLVLFMTSLVAGYMFLRSPWKRAVLALAVIPLALLRNGFRVFVIGELCVHVGPHMIDSPIHHYGGPIFFALSLVPFSILTWFLVKSDRAALKARPQPAQIS